MPAARNRKSAGRFCIDGGMGSLTVRRFLNAVPAVDWKKALCRVKVKHHPRLKTKDSSEPSTLGMRFGDYHYRPLPPVAKNLLLIEPVVAADASRYPIWFQSLPPEAWTSSRLRTRMSLRPFEIRRLRFLASDHHE